MSNLINQNWIGLDGKPVTGRVPPTIRMMAGVMTPPLMADVAHRYQIFCLNKQAAVGDYFVSNKVLPDGSRVRIVSNMGVDVVMVWSAHASTDHDIPHGFVVAPSWDAAPFIYARVLEGSPATVRWKFVKGLAIDQIKGPHGSQIATYDQVIQRGEAGGKGYNIVAPLVANQITGKLWDYARHPGVTSGSAEDAYAPVNLVLDGEFNVHATHFAKNATICKPDLTPIYALPDTPRILAVVDEDAEKRKLFPAAQDSSGKQVALHQMRYATISMIANVQMFRLCHEVLSRESKDAYQVVTRRIHTLTTPMPAATQTVLSENGPGLGEDPAPDVVSFLGYVGGVYGVGVLSDTGEYAKWATTFSWIPQDVNSVPWTLNFDESFTQKLHQSAGEQVTDDLIPVGGVSGIDTIKLVNKLNYPAEIYWRAGQCKRGFDPDDLYGVNDKPVNYGVNASMYDRRDMNYMVDAQPQFILDAGWCQIKLMEGVTHGGMTGERHTNTTWTHASFRDLPERDYVTTGDAYPPYGDPWTAAFLSATNIKPDLVELFDEYTPTPENNFGIKVEVISDNLPVNEGSYTFASRHLLDYDHRARFWAAMKFEVKCSGAMWPHVGGYLGQMGVAGPASYEVRIWFEHEWASTGVKEKLLYQGACSRPPFEFISLLRINPYYWPLPIEPERPLYVRVPPEPKPDERIMDFVEVMARHQGVNPHLVSADFRDDVDPAWKLDSTKGIEFSKVEGGREYPHEKRVTGMLYTRTFKISDFPNSIWLLDKLRMNAPLDDFIPDWDPDRPGWYYMPGLRDFIQNETIHIEIRDGEHVNWMDDIPGAPVANDRKPSLYQV